MTVNDTPLALRPVLATGAAVSPIIPASFEDVQRIASLIFASGMVPYSIKSKEATAVIIMHGAEIGLPPMTALQRIALIGGRPVIGADLALALAWRSGLMKEFREWSEGRIEDKTFRAHAEAWRHGNKTPFSSSFNVKHAQHAGLWDERPTIVDKYGKTIANPSPWYCYPERMIQMRARKSLFDAFGDVMGGLRMREEYEGVTIEHEPVDEWRDEPKRPLHPDIMMFNRDPELPDLPEDGDKNEHDGDI